MSYRCLARRCPCTQDICGLLLAAGKLDGVVGEGPDRHVVKGKVTKVVSKVEEYKGDVLEQRELDRYVVSIKVLDLSG